MPFLVYTSGVSLKNKKKMERVLDYVFLTLFVIYTLTCFKAIVTLVGHNYMKVLENAYSFTFT